jgi:hypothetical protein
MRIGIEINGILRDTFLKAEQIYQKFYIDEFVGSEVSASFDEETKKYVESDETDDFEYGLNLPVTNIEQLDKHFKFKNREDLFDFLYVDFPMQIFGNAPSVEMNTFNVLNEIYEELRDEHVVSIVSDEIQKSKPATLFFLSKYGCLCEKILFYSHATMDQLWEEHDIIVTSSPNLLRNQPDGKIVVKYNTTYNSDIDSKYTISSLSEIKSIYKQLNLK